MKTLTTWNPLREMEEFQNRFSTFFGGLPTFPFRFPKNGERFKMPDWSPLVDIIEDDHEYLFKADLPEMRKDDVKSHNRKRRPLHFRRTQNREGRKEEKIPSAGTLLRHVRAHIHRAGRCGHDQDRG